MYRQGLGDCFLITFDPGGRERHMLIDCGSLGAKTTGVTLAQVAADIRKTTNDHLDVVIATHEHKDHVSGFNGQRDQFKKIAVDHVWLAWTENPKDGLAKTIAKRKDDLAAALVHACRAMAAPSADKGLRPIGLAVHDVLGFAGDPDAPLAADFAETINEAMSFVRTGLTHAKTRYCKPGDGPFEEPWLDGFRIYVLGPPRSQTALDDAGEQGSAELYGVTMGLGSGAAFAASGLSAAEYLRASAGGDRDLFVAAQPFDPRFRLERESAAAREAFAGGYLDGSQAWRRVDSDWLQVASDLALQLDSSTNNTSLALAIERIADGKVLLFPADAQEGNWLSWHDPMLAWSVNDGGTRRNVTAAALLSRTVFYQVGHHASHNATARAKGLELMDQERELTAFIPVDRAVALGRNPPGSWRMPAVKLYRRLLEKCQGRVVRSDLGWADDAANAADKKVEKELAGLATKAEWASWKQSQKAATHVTIDTLFVDYVLQ
jgi:hypothetical protein